MTPRLPATRQVAVHVVAVAFESLSGLPCPTCESALELNQPDPNRPDLFLGVCAGCGVIHLVETSTDAGRARVVSLAPLVKALHRGGGLKRPADG